MILLVWYLIICTLKSVDLTLVVHQLVSLGGFPMCLPAMRIFDAAMISTRIHEIGVVGLRGGMLTPYVYYIIILRIPD